MSVPLTPEQEEQRLKRLSELPGELNSAQDALVSTSGLAGELFKTNDLNEAYWAYFNDFITLKYEEERKFIDGNYVLSPVVLQEIRDASQYSGRLDDAPNSSPKRIPEFDFGGLSPSLYFPREDQRPVFDAEAIDLLRNGFNDGPDPTATNTTTIDDSTSSATLTNTTNFVAGRRYFIRGASLSAIIELLSTDGVSGITFNYHNIDSVYFGPSGTIAPGASFFGSKAFSNIERTSQVASIAAEQNMLDREFLALDSTLAIRKTILLSQVTQLEGNLDPGLDLAYVSGIRETVSGITSYLDSPDYSNSGLTSIETIINDRNTDFASRLVAIPTYLVGSGKYYNFRYSEADIIGDKNSGSYAAYYGTLRSLAILEEQKQNIINVSGIYLIT